LDGAVVMGKDGMAKKLTLARMLQFIGFRESNVPPALAPASTGEGQVSVEGAASPSAREKFSELLFRSDALLGSAHRVDLEDCVRILGVYCAQYRTRFGDLPLSGTVEVLTSGAMDDDQVKVVADGLDLVVNVLDLMEQSAADIRP